jgi:DNA polymerase-3 subunit delta
LIHLFSGSDDYSLKQELHKIKTVMGDDEILSINTSYLDGLKIDLSEFKNVIETTPFLAKKRLVIINGFLSRFGTKTLAETSKTEIDLIRDLLGNMPSTTTLVLIDIIDGNDLFKNPLFMVIKSIADVRTFPQPNLSQLRQWTRERLRVRGGRMSDQAVEFLVRLIGSDLWILGSEIEKLIIYSDGRTISHKDVEEVVGFTQQLNVFNLVDAIIERRPGVAVTALEQLLKNGEQPTYILFMIARQLRLIVRAKSLMNQGERAISIKKILGIKSDFVWKKTVQQIQCFTMSHIIDLYNKLLETDIDIKTGRYDANLAVDMMVTELALIK